MLATDIKLNPSNPRIIKDDKFKKLVKSLKEFPEMATVRPVVIDETNTILGGNMRYKAMIEAGWEDIPITQVRGWSEEQKKEFIVKDNLAMGEWDYDVLANDYDMKQLEEYGMDLPDGLDETEIEEDEPPELDETSEPISKLGEVYQLGRHRLMCGDSTKIEDVEKLMDGKKADMVFTDPPYGISIVSNSGGVGGGTEGKYRPVLGDDSIKTAIDAYRLCSSLNIPKLIFWGGNYYSSALPNSSCWLVWDKQGGKRVTFADCELAWTNFDSPVRMFTHIWDGFRRDSERRENRVHPTQKPIKLLVDIMSEYVKNNVSILDLFGGSGSTLIACEQTDRTCFMMELDPKYCDVIRKRYENFVSAKHNGTD